MASPKDHHDADHEDAVCLVRRIAKTYLGGNAAFVDSDIRLLGILAQRAVLAGLTDDVRDGRTIRNMSRAAEAARADHESALGRSFSSGLMASPEEQAPLVLSPDQVCTEIPARTIMRESDGLTADWHFSELPPGWREVAAPELNDQVKIAARQQHIERLEATLAQILRKTPMVHDDCIRWQREIGAIASNALADDGDASAGPRMGERP